MVEREALGTLLNFAFQRHVVVYLTSAFATRGQTDKAKAKGEYSMQPRIEQSAP